MSLGDLTVKMGIISCNIRLDILTIWQRIVKYAYDRMVKRKQKWCLRHSEKSER